MLYQKILEEYQGIQNQIEELQTQISELPEGKLVCSHGSGCTKWYKSDGHTKEYISKKNRPLAEELAKKKYLSCSLDDLVHERRGLELYLRHHEKHTKDKAADLLSRNPGYRELLSSCFRPVSSELEQWANASSEQNPAHPEHLIHKTSSGLLVRSKSEAMISLFLHTNRIPFRYECAFRIGGVAIYPDFTIRHPETGKFFYWEHFGRMDDPAYAQTAASKLRLYITNGVVPSIQLICTYETVQRPLDYEEISRVAGHYFL